MHRGLRRRAGYHCIRAARCRARQRARAIASPVWRRRFPRSDVDADGNGRVAPSTLPSTGQRRRRIEEKHVTGASDTTAVIVDDEPLGRDMLRFRLAEHPQIRVIAECGSGAEGIAAIRKHRPDIAFLDVRLPDTDGFEVVAALRPAERPVVVFVTAHGDLALRGFDVRATAYLVKPYDRVQFVAALDAALDTLAGRRAVKQVGEGDGATRPRQWVMAREGRRSVLVAVRDVRWFQADGDYVRAHVRERIHFVDSSLSALEQELDGNQFVRVHRSAIVNLECIRELRTDDGRDYEIVLDNGARVRLS